MVTYMARTTSPFRSPCGSRPSRLVSIQPSSRPLPVGGLRLVHQTRIGWRSRRLCHATGPLAQKTPAVEEFRRMFARMQKLRAILANILRPTWVIALLVVAGGLVAGGLIGRYLM